MPCITLNFGSKSHFCCVVSSTLPGLLLIRFQESCHLHSEYIIPLILLHSGFKNTHTAQSTYCTTEHNICKYWHSQRIPVILFFSSSLSGFYQIRGKLAEEVEELSCSIHLCLNFLCGFFFLLVGSRFCFFHFFSWLSIGLWLFFLLLGFGKKNDFSDILAFMHAPHGIRHLRRDRGEADVMFLSGQPQKILLLMDKFKYQNFFWHYIEVYNKQ